MHENTITLNKNNIIMYPVIMAIHDEENGGVTVSSPNIPGMHTEGDTLSEAAFWSIDAIEVMLDGKEYPEPADTSDWKLADNERIVYIPVPKQG